MERNSHSHNYQRPHVEAEEEEEWPDDSSEDSYDETIHTDSSVIGHGSTKSQNHMVRRPQFQPVPDFPHHTTEPLRRYESGNSARAPRTYLSMPTTSPGGQAVPYDGRSRPIPTSHAQYPGQPSNLSPQYYPPHLYPGEDPKVESIRQKLEDMEMRSQENERMRIRNKIAEEKRKKRKRAEWQQKQKAKKQQAAQKLEFEAKLQQMKADFDKRLESASAGARHRDLTAELHNISGNFLPPQPASGYRGHVYGYDAQDKQAHDLSVIMRRLDSLVAPERSAPPFGWFDIQRPSAQYHNDRAMIDNLYSQIEDIQRRLHYYERTMSALSARQQSAGQLDGREYYSTYKHETPWMTRPPGEMRTGASRGRRQASPPQFSGIEEPDEDVESPQKNSRYREYACDSEDSASAVVSGRPSDENQQVAKKRPKKARKQQPLFNEKPEEIEYSNVTRVGTHHDTIAARRNDANEVGYDVNLGHSSDASEEMEEYEHRRRQYVMKPDPRFGREVVKGRERHPQSSNQYPHSTEDHASRAFTQPKM
ncbi:hypothetical protein F4802DRAFT_581928 [Xylaria palmicola]|nr:hypothetical protein F4802DRAFT_581928 [Xylaria palmicola]